MSEPNTSRWQRYFTEPTFPVQPPRWEAPRGSSADSSQVSAHIDDRGNLHLRWELANAHGGLDIHESGAISLAQFIVNWYTPKPVNILDPPA